MSKSVFGIGNGIRTRKGTAPSDGKSKIIIKIIYKCWLGLIVIFLFFCWRVSLNSINNIFKMVQDENDGTRLEMSRNTVKQIEFPPCIDKANKTFYKSGLVGHKPIHKSLNKVPLPPFTSGDSPICQLKSSPLSPVPVILLSFGRTGSSSTWQVMSRLTGHCFTCREYTGTNSMKSDVFFLIFARVTTATGFWDIFVRNKMHTKTKEGLLALNGKDTNHLSIIMHLWMDYA